MICITIYSIQYIKNNINCCRTIISQLYVQKFIIKHKMPMLQTHKVQLLQKSTKYCKKCKSSAVKEKRCKVQCNCPLRKRSTSDSEKGISKNPMQINGEIIYFKCISITKGDTQCDPSPFILLYND